MIYLNFNSKPHQDSLSVVTIADEWPNHTDFSFAVKPIEGEILTKNFDCMKKCSFNVDYDEVNSC